MRRLKKSIYQGGAAGLIVLLAVLRCAFPGITQDDEIQLIADNPQVEALPVDSLAEDVLAEDVEADEPEEVEVNDADTLAVTPQPGKKAKPSGPVPTVGAAPQFADAEGNRIKHKIYSVSSYAKSFPDLQDTQIVAAMEWGVQPVANREQAELRKSELVFVGSNPYYCIDAGMNRSIPYLVPRAADLLQTIGRNFLDSLAIKHVPAHKIIVSSVLRTEDDVRRLRRGNVNASEQSCHRFGTTFDISYLRYKTVCPPGETRREVRNDSLLFVLSEVLNDLRKADRCYVKYERKQSCFHITVR